MVGETVTNPIDGEPIRHLPSMEGVTPDQFRSEVLPAERPVVLRGIVNDWPAVTVGRQGDARAMAEYILRFDSGRPLSALVGDPQAGGRFFYKPDMQTYNFRRELGPARIVLSAMLQFTQAPGQPHVYAGSTVANDAFPGLDRENPMPFVPEGTEPRAWIGNTSRIAPHYDVYENLAVCVMGRRQFMLFPPEQVANLYVGPWEKTPAGRECSFVDVREPDLEAFPLYAKARDAALLADLQPGDALYMPPLWWHTVEAREGFNLLVNYWWKTEGMNGRPMAALAHALLTIRDLPLSQREAWKSFFDFYVFGEGAGNAGDHIPEHARGVRGATSDTRDRDIRSFIESML